LFGYLLARIANNSLKRVGTGGIPHFPSCWWQYLVDIWLTDRKYQQNIQPKKISPKILPARQA
jgi:hypothetical protein